MAKKKQQIRCKILTPREQTLERIRATLKVTVPMLIKEIKARGKDNQEGFTRELEEHVRSGNAAQGLLSGVSQLWINDKTNKCDVQAVALIAKTLAICSFTPGGTTAAIGTKFMGLEFDAKDFK